jgi:hypothetical protein
MQKHVVGRAAPVLGALITVFTLAACGDSVGVGDGGNVSLTFMHATTASPAFSRSPAPAASALDSVNDGRHTLALESAVVTFSRLDFDRDEHGDEDDENEERDNQSLVTTPVTVDLVAHDGASAALSVPVPPGTYEGLDGKVQSVRVRGTFDAKAFDVTIPIEAKFQSEFDTPLTVKDGEPLNVTVSIDPSLWFRSAAGILVDPSLAIGDASVRAHLKVRIRSAFRAFRDRNRDGRDD